MSQDTNADHLLQLAVAAGKICPAQVPGLRELYETNPDAVLTVIAATPVDAVADTTAAEANRGAQAAELSAYARRHGLTFAEARTAAIRELRELEKR